MREKKERKKSGKTENGVALLSRILLLIKTSHEYATLCYVASGWYKSMWASSSIVVNIFWWHWWCYEEGTVILSCELVRSHHIPLLEYDLQKMYHFTAKSVSIHEQHSENVCIFVSLFFKETYLLVNLLPAPPPRHFLFRVCKNCPHFWLRNIANKVGKKTA